MRYYSWLKNKNIIISGCSTGLGRELAIQLAKKKNCNIFGIARNISKLESLKNEIGDKFNYISIDIGIKESWISVANKLKEIDFKPDVLINNAGVIHNVERFDQLTDEEIERVIAVDLLGGIYGIKALLPLLQESAYPSIVNICSASAYMPTVGASVYSASKMGMLGFTEALRQEFFKQKIYISAVMPGPIKTDLYRTRKENSDDNSKEQGSFIENFGSTTKKIVRRIIIGMCFARTRMTVDVTGLVLDKFKRFLPRTSTYIWGSIFRLVKVKPYADIFKGEKSERLKRIKMRKELKKKDKKH